MGHGQAVSGAGRAGSFTYSAGTRARALLYPRARRWRLDKAEWRALAERLARAEAELQRTNAEWLADSNEATRAARLDAKFEHRAAEAAALWEIRRAEREKRESSAR